MIELAKCSYNGMNTFMKTHIVLNYTLNDNNVSSDYIRSIYNELVEESLLKNEFHHSYSQIMYLCICFFTQNMSETTQE